MKKLLLTYTLFILSFCAIAQNTAMKSEYLLDKSKKQRTAGIITITSGTASLVSGLILLNQTSPGWQNVEWGKALGGTALTITGVGLLTSGIVLFIAADRNKRKANLLSVELNKPVLINTGFQRTVLPYSMSVSIAIR
jgi:hypothetical protein